MEGAVQSQDVPRQVGTQGVGRLPAEVLRRIGLSDDRDLREQRDHEEHERDADEDGERRAGLSLVDEALRDQWIRQLEPDACEQQNAQNKDASPVWPEIRSEQCTVELR
jgi:hypothetical protein